MAKRFRTKRTGEEDPESSEEEEAAEESADVKQEPVKTEQSKVIISVFVILSDFFSLLMISWLEGVVSGIYVMQLEQAYCKI